MIKKITIELSDGTKYRLKRLSELQSIDRSKSALFLFDNGEIFIGRSVGEIDEDGDFDIILQGKTYPSAFPLKKLIGWAYLKGISQGEVLIKSIKEGGKG